MAIINNRNVANRRSDDELKKLQAELDETTYKLQEQTDFKGTEEELKWMQGLERAYIDGRPQISDEEWDHLRKKFNYEESLTSIAPSGRTWVRMGSPLGSIQKETNIEGIKSFLSEFEGKEFQVEVKLDGLTVNSFYKRVLVNKYKNNKIVLRQEPGESEDDFKRRCEELKKL